MAAKQIWLGLSIVPCGSVNTFLIDGGADGLILIDAGFPGKADLILDGIRNIGRRPSEVKHIVLTHAHSDHIGGLADLVKATGAQTWMHELDAPIAEAGSGFRPITPAGQVPRLLMTYVFKPPTSVAPARIDHRIKDGDVIPLAGGLRVISMPGHCAGQVALLWQGHRVMFVADTAMHLFGMLSGPIGFENKEQGQRDLKRLAAFDYDLACFGHGPPLSGHASIKMQRKWGEVDELSPTLASGH